MGDELGHLGVGELGLLVVLALVGGHGALVVVFHVLLLYLLLVLHIVLSLDELAHIALGEFVGEGAQAGGLGGAGDG